MRLPSFFLVSAAVMVAGCSHESKKPDPTSKPEAQAAAPKSADTHSVDTEKSATTGTKVECSVKGDERILEVRAKDGGCEFVYTKAGKEGVVASANHGTDYCAKAMNKVEEKLKGAGYQCK